MKLLRVFALCLAAVLTAWIEDAAARPDTLAVRSPGAGQVHHEEGLVTGVADGDTLYVEIDGKVMRVRLAQIDAPEKSQAFGRRSEQSLRELVGKRRVALTWRTIDRWGRPVVQVHAGDVDVNAEQVRRGYAWVYRAYSHDPHLIDLEAEAQAAKRGLWADPHPVEPWVWRRTDKSL